MLLASPDNPALWANPNDFNAGQPQQPSAATIPQAVTPPQAQPQGGFPASLIRTESGGNWNALNNVPGAGGHVGHGGRLQFGTARLEDAARAGVIPPMTAQEFARQPPEIQMAVENWHFSDIDNFIRQNGLDRMIGQTINGVPVTLDGMRAVAHLGGVGGLRRFIESGGQYNPSDANGTSLLDYLSTHGGSTGGTQPMPQGLLGTVSTSSADPQNPSIWDALVGRLPDRVQPLARRTIGDADWRDRMAIALAGMSMRPNEALIGTLQGRMESRDEERRRNQTIAYLESIGRTDLVAAITAGLPVGEAMAAAVAPQAVPQARMSQILEDGTIIQSTDTGPRVFSAGGTELVGQDAIDAIAEANRQRVENERAVYEGRRQGTLGAEVDMGRDANRELAAGTIEGQNQANNMAQAPGDIQAAEMALTAIADLRNHPALSGDGNVIQNFIDGGVGMSSLANMRPGSPGYDLNARVEQLKGNAFLTAIQQLRGMGALSNNEGDAATSAITRLSTGLSEQDFNAALDDFERVLRLGLERAQRIAGGGIVQTPLQPPAPTSDEIQRLLDQYAPVQ